MSAQPTSYRASQIALHWLVFALVAYQFFTGDNATDVFHASQRQVAPEISTAWMPVHLVVGLVILGAMIWRLTLRQRLGVPEAPSTESAPLIWLSRAVHLGLYLDLIGAPIVGLLTYFWFPGLGWLHELMTRQVLLVLFGLHVAGALWHQFYWRDGVLLRMLRPGAR